MKTDMKNISIIKKTFFKLLPLQIIVVAVSSINSIIDGVVATNLLGPVALSVCGLFLPIIKLIDTVNVTLLSGAQILCGQYVGQNQIKRAKGIFSLDMIVVVLFGAISSFCCYVLCNQISHFLVNDNELVNSLCEYMKGYAPGIIAYLLVSQLTAFLQIENQGKRVYIGMAVAIVANVILNIVFVAKLGLGLFGLGLATSCSNVIYVIILLLYYFSNKAGISFSLSSISIKDIITISKIGFPGALAQLSQVIRGILLNFIMLKYAGTFGIAAFSAVNAFGCLYYATTAGIANATRVLCSFYAGEEDKNALQEVMETAVKNGGMIILMVTALLMACSGLFTNIFFAADVGIVYDMTFMGFLIFPLTMPFSCMCTIYVNYYQCRDKLNIANLLSIFDGMIGVILFSVLLAPRYSMNGIWAAHVLNGVLCIVIILLYTCIMEKHFPTSVEDTLLLPDSFGVSFENRIDVCIKSMEETIELSRRVMDFCSKHQVDKKHASYTGLCIEEMAGNIIKHGFSDGKSHSIDIRVLIKGSKLLVRIKDDCKMFNPKAMQEMMSPKDVTKNIGIRLISKLASNIEYINSFGLNVLTIELSCNSNIA